MTANECSVAWCSVDHSLPHDDVDGCGSQFHFSDMQYWSSGPIADSQDSITWSVSDEVCWVEFCRFDSALVTPPAGAIRLRVNDQAALTEAQVRQLAAWFTARADELRYLNNPEEVASCPST